VRAIYRFVGSIAFVGAARTGFAVVKDPDDDARRLVLPVKSNVGAMPSGLAYRLEQVVVGYFGTNGHAVPIEASTRCAPGCSTASIGRPGSPARRASA
jgi:hypothetical protein